MSIVRRPLPDLPSEYGDHFHPVLARVYAARGVGSPTELDHRLENLHSFESLMGVDRAVELLIQAIELDQRILVVGDFDADGATGCAVAVRGLRLLGARQVDFLVPDRFAYGYGLTPEIVAVAEQRQPDLLITVDNGVSSIDGVAAANRAGIPVIVTDHHLAGAELPAAAALVNPNQPDDAFPSKALAGVGVMFYVLVALRAALRLKGWFEKSHTAPNLGQLLDLVALGTVADVVALDFNNRVLVSQGLKRIRAGRGCPGIRALLQVGGRDAMHAVASDLGFSVGPRLNAAGRLTDMGLGIECLLSDDFEQALDIAARLDDLNRERRSIEEEMKAQALSALGKLEFGVEGEMPLGLCLYDPSWHQGVVGILASRIKDRMHRPVIAFAPDGEHALKGSARSVSGVHVRDVLDAVATRNPGLLSRFGGHAMAAGLTLQLDDLDRFKVAFDQEVRRRASPADLRGVTHTDGPLAPEQLDLDLARALRAGGPWGQGFPEPLFDGEFEIREARVVGGRHMRLRVSSGGSRKVTDGIAFGAADDWPKGASRMLLAYRLEVNRYQGLETAQLLVEKWEMLA